MYRDCARTVCLLPPVKLLDPFVWSGVRLLADRPQTCRRGLLSQCSHELKGTAVIYLVLKEGEALQVGICKSVVTLRSVWAGVGVCVVQNNARWGGPVSVSLESVRVLTGEEAVGGLKDLAADQCE